MDAAELCELYPPPNARDVHPMQAEVFDTPTPEPRTTPARDYRIRIHTDRIDGPIWLRLLATLGYALGVAGDECYGIAT